ncbi:MAG: hypothetical protein NC111_01805 [Bacteroides sp.]|nr:hypothetical protein [Bacteroides sp.]MCM1413805.1 hypothetical protein [Bacteroides sp.]MCM1471251.1 hypothetical protein [Bacteroides sp.]
MPHLLAIIIIATSFLCGRSQILDRAHNGLRHGDSPEFARIDFADTVTAKHNAIWDLSQCTISDAIKVHLEYASDSTNIVRCAVGRTIYYYRIAGDSILIDGFENNQSSMLYYVGETSLLFPLTKGHAIDGVFHGEGLYCDRWSHTMSGTYHTEADASGMLILPEGDTIPDVVRIRTRRMIDSRYFSSATASSMIDSLRFYQDDRRWYAPGYRYPLLISSTMTASDATTPRHHVAYYSSASMASALENDPLNVDRRQQLATSHHSSLFDNTVYGSCPKSSTPTVNYTFSHDSNADTVSITFTTAEPLDVEIGLSDAMGIVYFTDRRTAQPYQPQTLTFDYARLPYSANYVIFINAAAEHYSENFHR